jgi:hypothetical protein
MSINETARNRLTSTDASASASSAKVYRSDAAGDDRAKMGHVVVASGHIPEHRFAVLAVHVLAVNQRRRRLPELRPEEG